MSEEIVLVALPSIPAVIGVDIQQGVPGAAATIEVGTVTTGEPGTDAAITNSGTTAAAVLDFAIPRGATGATGADGTNGADGDDGMSAYASAQAGGYTDTEVHFYSDLATIQTLAAELEALL